MIPSLSAARSLWARAAFLQRTNSVVTVTTALPHLAAEPPQSGDRASSKKRDREQLVDASCSSFVNTAILLPESAPVLDFLPYSAFAAPPCRRTSERLRKQREKGNSRRQDKMAAMRNHLVTLFFAQISAVTAARRKGVVKPMDGGRDKQPVQEGPTVGKRGASPAGSPSKRGRHATLLHSQKVSLLQHDGGMWVGNLRAFWRTNCKCHAPRRRNCFPGHVTT